MCTKSCGDRSRSQKVAELSRTFGRIYAFAEDGVGGNLDKIRAALGASGKFMNDIGLEGLNKEAVRRFLDVVQ